MTRRTPPRAAMGLALLLFVAGSAAAQGDYPEPGPLPSLAARVDPELAELGKLLFFDFQLSGDATVACATCHDPQKGWGDGMPLSDAYPGSKYFRNAQTLLNASHGRYFYWDGRLTARDRPTLVRDSISESHFMNMDGRIMLERLKQIPEYVERFNATLGGEPSYGRTLQAVAAFLDTIESRNVPFDRGAMSAEAKAGYELYKGKAGCIQCHNGPYFSDAEPYNIGVPDNPDIVGDPMRHLTMRSVFKFMGVYGFETVKKDVGHVTVSKDEADYGKFITPTLREVTRTAPYMHNGMLATLEDVIEFYDAGGGEAENKAAKLAPLDLSADEKKQLLAFLEALSGDEIIVATPEVREPQTIENWRQVSN